MTKDEPEPLEVEVFRNRPVTKEETTTLIASSRGYH